MICRPAPLLFVSISAASLVVGVASCSPDMVVRVADADRTERPASTNSSSSGGSSDPASDRKSSVGGEAGVTSSGGAGHGGGSTASSGGQSKTGGSGGKGGSSVTSSARGGTRAPDGGASIAPSTRRLDASVFADARSGGEVAPPACDDITSNGRLAVYYYTGNQESQTQDVNMHLAVVNFTAENARLSQITVRYWFTDEGAGKSNNLTIYYTPPTLAKITTKFLPATPLRTGADTVLEFTFTPSPDAGISFLETTEFNFAFHKDNYTTTYNLADDYSYDGSLTKGFGRNPRITAYIGNQLAWGCEPPVAAVTADAGTDPVVDASARARDR